MLNNERSKKKELLFTDLDGTLLDKDYSFKPAETALKLLKKNDIPLILCTSKTFEETLEFVKKLGVNYPVIVESGGAIYIPCCYFKFNYDFDFIFNGYYVIELGGDYPQLEKVLAIIKKQVPVKVLSELPFEEIAKVTGLSIEQARLVQAHKYELALIFEKSNENKVMNIAVENGFKITRGRFYFLKKSSKGEAVRKLVALYQRQYGQIKTYAIGDSANDESLLDAVDEPYLVKNLENQYFSKKYNLADGVGPEGWNKIILSKFS